ncbi:MAG TPA: hypothetical protein DDX71_03455 [Ruminococcus sp.]|nr:hypothetical protein [Ruminococcus sp.]
MSSSSGAIRQIAQTASREETQFAPFRQIPHRIGRSGSPENSSEGVIQMPQTPKLRLLLAGGDLRQNAAAAMLTASAAVCGLGIGALPAGVTDANAVPDAVFDALLLPLPAVPDGIHVYAPQSSEPISLAGLLKRVRTGGTVLGGLLSAETAAAIAQAGLHSCDYAAADAFAVRNAVPTAEAAIEIALRELPVTLHGLSCVMLGAGRVSQALQPRLLAMGAQVTIAARRSADLARRKGCKRKPVCLCRKCLQSAAKCAILSMYANPSHEKEYTLCSLMQKHSIRWHGFPVWIFRRRKQSRFRRALPKC